MWAIRAEHHFCNSQSIAFPPKRSSSCAPVLKWRFTPRPLRGSIVVLLAALTASCASAQQAPGNASPFTARVLASEPGTCAVGEAYLGSAPWTVANGSLDSISVSGAGVATINFGHASVPALAAGDKIIVVGSTAAPDLNSTYRMTGANTFVARGASPGTYKDSTLLIAVPHAGMLRMCTAPNVWNDAIPKTVNQFGARGDGKADDYSAIQAAIDAVSTNGHGGVLTFAPSAYYVSHTLTIPISARNIKLEGYGATLDGYVQSGPILKISDLTTPKNRVEGIWIKGLTINGRGWRQGAPYATQDGIELDACLHVKFEDLNIQNIPRDAFVGIKSSAAGSEFWNIVMLDHVIIRYTGRHGLLVGAAGPAVDDIELNDCLLNNLGANVANAVAGDGGVYVAANSLTMVGGEISAVRNDTTGTGYLNALYVRRATGSINATHFELNGNDQESSNDIFLDKDDNGMVILGTSHTSATPRGARTAIKSTSKGVSIMGVTATGTSRHAYTNVIDAQRAESNTVTGVTDVAGGAPPKSNYVLKPK